MRGAEKSNSIGHLAVLAGLWSINILIVIFGIPFLIYKKIREVFVKKAKISEPPAQSNPKSPQYFPCGINTKL